MNKMHAVLTCQAVSGRDTKRRFRHDHTNRVYSKWNNKTCFIFNTLLLAIRRARRAHVSMGVQVTVWEAGGAREGAAPHSRPSDYETDALPAELILHVVTAMCGRCPRRGSGRAGVRAGVACRARVRRRFQPQLAVVKALKCVCVRVRIAIDGDGNWVGRVMPGTRDWRAGGSGRRSGRRYRAAVPEWPL